MADKAGLRSRDSDTVHMVAVKATVTATTMPICQLTQPEPVSDVRVWGQFLRKGDRHSCPAARPDSWASSSRQRTAWLCAVLRCQSAFREPMPGLPGLWGRLYGAAVALASSGSERAVWPVPGGVTVAGRNLGQAQHPRESWDQSKQGHVFRTASPPHTVCLNTRAAEIWGQWEGPSASCPASDRWRGRSAEGWE